MLNFIKSLFKKKPKKVYHCTYCGNPVDQKSNVFVFDGGRTLLHNDVICVWGWGKQTGRYMRNVHSVPFKKIKKSLT